MDKLHCVVNDVAYKAVPELGPHTGCGGCAGEGVGMSLCRALPNCSSRLDASLPYEAIWVVDIDPPKKNPLLTVDWLLLSRQKEYLLMKAALAPVKEEEQMLDGIVHLFDALQDYAVSEGIANSATVFPPVGERDE